jgi:hypothetical protein
VSTNKGEATVELRSASETVTSMVVATASGYRSGKLQIEFIPVAAETVSRAKKS